MSKKVQAKDPLSKLKQDLDKANNFVDYFLVCGVKPSLCLDESLYEIDLNNPQPNIPIQPEILTKCPSFDKSLVSIDEGILTYCFLSEFKIQHKSQPPKEELFSFILDNNFFSIEYPQKYVTCLCFYEPLTNYKKLKEKIYPSKKPVRQIPDELSQSVIMPEMDKLSMATDFRSSSIFPSVNSVLKKLYIPKVICLISIYPFINQHKRILRSIYDYSRMSKLSIPIEKIILNLIIEVPVPPRGVSSVEYQIINKKMNLVRKEFNKLPSVDFDIELICLVFNQEQISTIFKHLLLETKIIFFSNRINSLFNMIMGFLVLLYPLKYPFQVASYVTKPNYAIIESISPYILGINQSYVNNFFEENEIEISDMSILVVDIDNKKVILKSTESFPMLPKSLGSKLEKSILAQITNLKEVTKDEKNPDFAEEFCSCFFMFIANIMKKYNKYLNNDYFTSNENIQNTNIKTLFKGEEYVQKFSSSDQPFIDKFINDSQMFSDFIYKRMIPKDNKEKLEILFLDENITENRRTIFRKAHNIFINSEEYAIKNNYIALKSRELNQAETNSLLVEENRIKSLQYAQEITVNNKNQICFSYPLFPVFNNDIFFNEKSLSEYNLPPCLIEEVEAINIDIVSKSTISSMKVHSFEMENYIYLNWLQLWAFSFGYQHTDEQEYFFDQMITILNKVTHHEIEVFNLIFQALKEKEKTEMIIRLYQKLRIFKINPSSYIYTIIYKLIDKNMIKSLTDNPYEKWTFAENEKQSPLKARTLKTIYEDKVVGENVKFYTDYTCIECQTYLNLETKSKDFSNMSRDIMWALCPKCNIYILPKLKIRVGQELNITPDIEGQTSTIDEVVLHSPYHLKVNVKEGLFREYGIFLDVEEFKMKFTALFWNSIWYFRLLGLDYSFMLPYLKEKNPSSSLGKRVKVKYTTLFQPKVKVIQPIKKEKFSNLSISEINEDTSFELSHKIIKLIGTSNPTLDTKEAMFNSQSISILDNTMISIDTVSRLSEYDRESIFTNQLRRNSLDLLKIEEVDEEKGLEKINQEPRQVLSFGTIAVEKNHNLFQVEQDVEINLDKINTILIEIENKKDNEIADVKEKDDNKPQNKQESEIHQ